MWTLLKIFSGILILECDVLEQLEENKFLDNCLDILVSFSNATEYVQSFEPNISLSILERRSEIEVRAQKGGDVCISPVLTSGNYPPVASLVATVADLINNVSGFRRCPVKEWNERGLYRLLFRCASWNKGSSQEVDSVRAAACRALVVATTHKSVRTTLSTTKDCLLNLMSTLTPFEEEDNDLDCYNARAQALLLISSLLAERSAVDSVWEYLKEQTSIDLLHLILQCLNSDEIELQDAGLHCLTQLAQSISNNKNVDNTKVETYLEYYDNLKSPFNTGDRYSSGDNANDCQPDYMAEELCKALINLYQKLSLENSQFHTAQDDRWSRTCACITAVLSSSSRSRTYASHRLLPRCLATTVQAVRDALSVHGKPADVIRTADHNPVLRTLYWLLTVANATMIDCPAAKESFADDNIAVSLNRLWPWCMTTDQLRHAIMQFLFTFSNECSKGWSAMCICVSGRSLIGEVCILCVRETALYSRARSDALLLLTLHTARHCLQHHHCRALVLKSELMSSMYKCSVRERTRGCSAAGAAWAQICVELAKHAEGAAAVLAIVGAGKGAMAALGPPLRARLMPAIAHAATHHRVTFLQSSDLLELLSGTLLVGDTAEIVSAARAVWALAANNHKAKLLLRSAGVASAVQSTLQRMQNSRHDPASERALQLLTYTNTVLQTT